MDDKIISKFKRIVGSSYVIMNICELIPYHLLAGSRPLNKSDMAEVAVRPATSNEVSKIIKFANKEDIKISVRSGGTAITGHKPHRGEVILDLSRMDSVRVNREDGYAEVGPAVTPVELNETLGKYGYWFPVYPTCSDVVASIAGIISVNTSGQVCDPMLGKPGDYVSGLEVVLPTGEIIETGNKSIRRAAGPDLTSLFIGGEGLFGVITKIWMRLAPKPVKEKWALVVFQLLHDAAKAVQKIYYQGIYPTWMSLLDEKKVEVCSKRLGIEIPRGACLMIRTSGYMPGEATWKLEKLIGICKEEKALEVKMMEEAEWIRLSQLIAQGGERSELRARDWWGAGDYIDPPLSRYVSIIDKMQEKIMAAVDAKEYIFCLDAHGPLVYWPKIYISKKAWDGLNPELKEELEKMQTWKDYWAAYGRCQVGFFPGYAESWKAHYGATSYRLLIGLKRLFDPKNMLNPTNLPGEGD